MFGLLPSVLDGKQHFELYALHAGFAHAVRAVPDVRFPALHTAVVLEISKHLASMFGGNQLADSVCGFNRKEPRLKEYIVQDVLLLSHLGPPRMAASECRGYSVIADVRVDLCRSEVRVS